LEKTKDKLKLHRWCIRRLLQGWPVSNVADHAQTPQRTIYAWWNRFQWNEWVGLTDASRRPHRIHTLPKETVQKVLEVRRREGWCSETIAAYLQRQKVQVSSGSVHSILKQNQLITKPYKPRRQRTYIRFQRAHPDSLWQTDIKYYGNRYLIAFRDDCSRYLTGIAPPQRSHNQQNPPPPRRNPPPRKNTETDPQRSWHTILQRRRRKLIHSLPRSP